MKKGNPNILLAAYYAEIDTLDRLIKSTHDLDFELDLGERYPYQKGSIIKLSVFHILEMNLHVWLDIKHVTELKNEKTINPKANYEKTLDCINILAKRFPEFEITTIEYQKHIKLIYDFDESNQWIDDDEMQEYELEGYRRIDLELINAGMNRNEKKIIELLQQGASPMIDPFDKTDVSALIESLASADSFYFIDFTYDHLNKINSLDTVDKRKPIDLLKYLYGCASSARMLDIIREYTMFQDNIFE
jgi:hypothetical protein